MQRLVMLEVIGELGALLLLALHDARTEDTVVPQTLTQATDQRGVLREALHQNLLGAIQRRLGIGHVLVGSDETGRLSLRLQRRVREQRIGQRLQPRFTRDLGLGTALLAIRQIKIFQALLAVGGQHIPLKRGAQLVLLGDRFEHDLTPLLQLTQIAQALFELTHLGVIEPAGGFLAVARDERHGRAAIQQLDGGGDLFFAHPKLTGQRLLNAASGGSGRQRRCRTGGGSVSCSSVHETSVPYSRIHAAIYRRPGRGIDRAVCITMSSRYHKAARLL